MRVVFAGTPRTAVPSLAALLASRHELAAVVTRPDAATGRGREMPLRAFADAPPAMKISPHAARPSR